MNARIYSIIIMLVISTTLVNAQDYDDNAKTSFGVQGGINFQNLSGKDAAGDKLENDMILGFHAGFSLQIPVAPDFYFQPGLLFSTKGGANTIAGVTGTYKLSYIEMPLNLLYKSQVGSGYVLLGFGPYIGYAIGGKAKYEGGGASIEQDIVFQKTVEVGDPAETYFKAFDAGGNIFFGYQLAGGLFFQLNTQLGMININPEDKRIADNKMSVKNTGFGLSLGYRF